MTRHLRGDRGSAIVEAPLAICLLLLLAMGATTLVQVTWTHLALASAARATTRYATHVDYDPTAAGLDRHRTAQQVEAWAEEVAAEAHVTRDDVTIVGRRMPSRAEVPIEQLAQLVAGDEIEITIAVVVSNPLYRLGASIANTASHVVGAGDVFPPDGVGISAGATTYVE